MIRLLTWLLFLNIALMVVIPLSLMVTDIALDIAGPLVCTSGETLVRTGTRNIHFDCVMTDGGKSRDVSWLPMLVIVPLALTLVTSVLLAAAQSRRKAADGQAWTTAETQSSNFTVTSSSGSQGAKVISFTSGGGSSGEPVVVRVATDEGTKIIEIDPANAENPVVVRKAKVGETDASDDADAVSINMGDFFKSDLFSNLPDMPDNSLKAKLQQLQETYQAGLITPEEFERKKQEILDAF